MNNTNNKNGVVTETCGCVYNWNDKFMEVYCAEHKPEAEIFSAEPAEFKTPSYLPPTRPNPKRLKVGDVWID